MEKWTYSMDDRSRHPPPADPPSGEVITPDKIMQLLDAAKRLTGDDAAASAHLLLTAAACLATNKTTFLAAAARLWDIIQPALQDDAK